MARYNNPKTGKTVEAKNRAEAMKPKPAPTIKKTVIKKKDEE
jgi:hypothetical protein